LKKLLAIIFITLLTACVTPPPVETRQDAFADSYTQIEALANDVNDARANGAIDDIQALRLKMQLQKALDTLTEAEKLSDIGEVNQRSNNAKIILQDIRKNLIDHGAKAHE